MKSRSLTVDTMIHKQKPIRDARRLGVWTPEFERYHSAIPSESRLTRIVAATARFRIVEDLP